MAHKGLSQQDSGRALPHRGGRVPADLQANSRNGGRLVDQVHGQQDPHEAAEAAGMRANTSVTSCPRARATVEVSKDAWALRSLGRDSGVRTRVPAAAWGKLVLSPCCAG